MSASAAQRRQRKRALRAPAPEEVPLVLVRLEAEIAPQQQEVGADRLRVRHQACRRIGIAEDRRAAGTGIFPPSRSRDRLAVVAQIRLVIEVDAHHRRAVGVHDVDRVEASTA